MKKLIELSTEHTKLALKQLHGEDDAYAVFEAIEDNRIYLSQLGNTVGTTLTDVEKIQADWAKNPNALYLGLWKDKDLKTVISAHPSESPNTIEIGYWTRYNAQGNGYAAIALKALSEYLSPTYEHVIAKVHSENIPSANILRSTGYTYKGITEENWCADAMLFEFEKSLGVQ